MRPETELVKRLEETRLLRKEWREELREARKRQDYQYGQYTQDIIAEINTEISLLKWILNVE